MKLMTDLALAGQRVLIREDLNVPLRDGVITNDARLGAAVPSILAALEPVSYTHLTLPTTPYV